MNNPFKDQRPRFGQDPFLVVHEGRRWLIQSEDESKIVLQDFDDSTQHPLTLWDSPNDLQVWAPEIHKIDNKWYIFYACSDGNNRNHRTYVLGSPSSPFGPYTLKTRVGPDIWGIDMSTFKHNNIRYAVWSGWDRNEDEFPQHLFIARMFTPISLGHRIRLASPTLPWENSHRALLEGPQALHAPDGTLFIAYSANASWTTDYATGLLELAGTNPLNPLAWQKRQQPLAINTGHGQFLDGTFYYHKKLSNGPGWMDRIIDSRPYDFRNLNYPILLGGD